MGSELSRNGRQNVMEVCKTCLRCSSHTYTYMGPVLC